MKKLLFLCCALLLLAACAQEEDKAKGKETKGDNKMNEQLIGKWEGNIETPNGAFPIIVEMQKDNGKLSVPAQGNYLFKSITYNGDQVNVSINLNGSVVEINGTLKDGQIEATFQQNGGKFPLVLKPFKEQPEQPVTYETLKIPVQNGELTAALQKASNEPSPIALIIAGSGPTDKDGNSALAGKNNSLKMIAEGLAKDGIATVRYDKRGIGDNQSLLTKEEDITFDQYVDDAVQVINTLLADKAFSSVHIIGHSEGSLIGLLAAQKTKVESFVSIAGTGRPIDEVLLEQLKVQLTPALLKESTDALASLKKGQQVKNVSQELQSLFRPSIQSYMISWLKYNPASELAKVYSGVLIIQGTTDLQVGVTDAEALKKAKSDAELVYMDGMNHVLKNAPADRAKNFATYSDPTLPLHKELLPAIQQFIINENRD
ncbi:alpha/beta hydrolase [Lysinibacillus sp. NPDC056959]|uniref:alpha/beta hydrolase n=1 Tax=Lysinibacillus sp. NPDC056959 TaxID=3345981 RepID=UPI00362CFE6F